MRRQFSRSASSRDNSSGSFVPSNSTGTGSSSNGNRSNTNAANTTNNTNSSHSTSVRSIHKNTGTLLARGRSTLSKKTPSNSSAAGSASSGSTPHFLQDAKKNLRRSPSPSHNKFKSQQSQQQQSLLAKTLVKTSNTSISVASTSIHQHQTPVSLSKPKSKRSPSTGRIAKWSPQANVKVTTSKPAASTRIFTPLSAPSPVSISVSAPVSLPVPSAVVPSNSISKTNSNSNSYYNNIVINKNLTKTSKDAGEEDHSMHESGDQSNVWVRHSLIVNVLNPKPIYGSSSSNISNINSSLNGSFSPNANTNGNTNNPSTPLRKTPYKRSSTPVSFLPQKSASFKTGASNDDASTSASTTSSGPSNTTTPAKWGWVKALLLNNDDFSNKKSTKCEVEKPMPGSTPPVPAWQKRLKNTTGGPPTVAVSPAVPVPQSQPPKPDRERQNSVFTPSYKVSLKIIDLESEFYGQTLDIPISMITKDGVSSSGSGSSSKGNGTNSIFGDVIVMANAWPNFTSIPEKTSSVAPSTPVKLTPKSKWSAYASREEEKKGEDTNGNADSSKIPSDLTNLTHLHEPAVVYCLRSRYAMNEIYTSTGPILLALNPFKEVKCIYSDDIMKRYCDRGQAMLTGAISKKNADGAALPPHVYAVADNAYRAMMRALEDASGNADLDGSADQSILVSGESGAGKTVTTKIIMKYLAALSKRNSTKKVDKKPLASRWSGRPQNFASPPQALSDVASPNTVRGHNIEQQVLGSNPILESFGNARTLRNDNSSRFGKFIEIKFTAAGKLIGASVDSYLLEKVRLINQADGERNYHIFYELLAGASGAERKELLLGRMNPHDFIMTTSSSDIYKRRDGVRDDTTFVALRSAMVTMGFDSSVQNEILGIVSSLLHLSNITFAEDSSGCTIDAKNASLDPALQLLGVSGDALEKALCCVNIEAGGEKLVKKLFLDQSIKAKEALIKATYASLFAYLVQRINSCINGGISEIEEIVEGAELADKVESKIVPSVAAFIGVLDIFGFESFEKNSFEQLCINYCNESLQQQFNKFVFKLEQAEYEMEGIQWNFITFPDNQNVLDFIDKKRNGILSILDEQSFLTQCTDQSFAQLVYQKCGGGRAEKGSAFSANSRQMAHGAFSIHHYAGPVEYDTNGFLEKNKDELPNQIDELLHSSNNHFLRLLASVMTGSSKPSEEDASKPAFRQSSLKRITVGGQFSSQLQLLRKRIDAISPHYIRCLKPNDKLEPDNFDSAVIADQLRCAGILEAVRVSRVGYPQRYLHERFVQRYQVLAMKELQLRRKDASSTFSSPVGFGFHGGFVPQKNQRPTPAQRVGGNSHGQEQRLNPEQECKILVTVLSRQLLSAKENEDDTDDDENIPPPQNSWVSPGKQKKQRKWATPGATARYAPVASKKKQDLDLMDIGIQMGKTKVFLRQHAFEALELMSGRIKSATATVLNSVFRMYLKRRRYVIMRNEYRARVAQRSRMIQEGGVVNDNYLLEAANVSLDCGNKFDFREIQISLHREEDVRNPKDFKWVMVDNRWVKKDDDDEDDEYME